MDTAGSSGAKLITRKALFDIMQEHSVNFEDNLLHMENYLLKFYPYSEDDTRLLQAKITRLKSEFRKKWQEASRSVKKFLALNKNWLEGSIEIPRPISHAGRPPKAFEDSCARTKRRKTEDIRKTATPQELAYATKVAFYASGRRDASKVLSDIESSPTRATKYKQAFYKESGALCKLTPLQALAMFVDADLSRNQYEIIQSMSKSHASPIYPCYSFIQKAKRECYPNKEDINVTDTLAEISLQGILDLTVNRLLLYLEDVVETLSEVERESLVMICKWGCDGSHQSEYKQRFENEDDSDAAIFQSSFVPIRLICECNSKIIWQNPTPSSPRYCRPIRIRFIKETTAVINEEIKMIRDAINSLKLTTVDEKKNQC